MSVCPKTGEEFNVANQYNPKWNPHYDFKNPANLAEIEKMAKYDAAFAAVYKGAKTDDLEGDKVFLQECENAAFDKEYKKHFDVVYAIDADETSDAFKTSRAFMNAYTKKNEYEIGKEVPSDWGLNKVIGVVSENGEDVVKKEITVFANNMLSLQSHNGRREEWEVQNGTLSLIMDGDLYDVSDDGVFKVTGGKKEQITDPNVAVKNGDHWTMILQPGSAHCMINRSNDDVTVVEVQREICREADNKRFADQCRDKSPRAILPLTSEVLFKSAKIYWDVETEIASKPELRAKGWKASFTPNCAVA